MVHAQRSFRLLSAVMLMWPSVAFSQSAESIAIGGSAAFERAGSFRGEDGPLTNAFKLRTVEAAAPVKLGGLDDFDQWLKDHIQVCATQGRAASQPAAGAGPVTVDLSTLLNKQWKAGNPYSLGGQQAYISGSFDRKQNAYVSVYVDGWKQPSFFNIKGLLDKEGSVKIGNATYTVSLSANPLKPMKSKIIFENAANEDDAADITVKKLLDAVTQSGTTVQLSDQAYQTFYYNDVKPGANGPEIDPSSKTFAMILTAGEDLHVFLIPAETVPADKIAIFKMYQNKAIGLQAPGQTLKVYENP